MRILHVLDHSIPLQSGYAFRTQAILQQQRVLGWETFHVTSSKHYATQEPEEECSGFYFYRSPLLTGVLPRLPVISQVAIVETLAKRLAEVVLRVQPDLLHAHSPALNGLAALRVARRRRLPMVYEVRAFWEDAAVDHGTSRENGLRYRLTRRLETHILKQTDAVTTICEGLRQALLSRGIPADKVTVIPNAVDIENFAMNVPPDLELAQALGLENRTVLGFIGSFYAYEGLPILLKTLPLLINDFPKLKVLFVGGGPEDGTLRKLAAELGIQDRVVFTGRVAHHQVQSYYSLVDICVYPRLSIRLTETVTPLKPLEAMAQGKLVIASDVGGHRELIRDGETGFRFSAGEPAALAACLRRVLERREWWPALRAAARQFVEEERNWAVSVARYAEIYEKLVGTWKEKTQAGRRSVA